MPNRHEGRQVLPAHNCALKTVASGLVTRRAGAKRRRRYSALTGPAERRLSGVVWRLIAEVRSAIFGENTINRGGGRGSP